MPMVMSIMDAMRFCRMMPMNTIATMRIGNSNTPWWQP